MRTTSDNGLLIDKVELEEMSKSLRAIARRLFVSGDEAEGTTVARLADQFQNASCGYDPNVTPQPYDPPKENEERPNG